ncbi:hypothetical protein PG990_007664 [Apiospora arundinis]
MATSMTFWQLMPCSPKTPLTKKSALPFEILMGGEVANTVRAWILGFIFVTLGSGLNMFLSMRSPAISFPALVILLLVYPVGCIWAKVMPTRVFNTFGLRWTLNTGPFNIKEHVVIVLMSNVCISYAYSTDALLALQGKPFYNINLGWGFSLLFTLSSQLIGIALSGIFRRFLVWPSAMMWPNQFSNTALFYALHDKSKSDGVSTNGWYISRYRYFFIVVAGMFCYYWIPAVLWQGLSVFAFVTWIRPDNVVLNQLFGGVTGLSLIPITFDWTYVSAYLQDPLLSPTHSHINTLLGLFFFVILTTIGITYSGAIYADYLPMVTSQTYDNTQQAYNVSRILGSGFTFDVAKYKDYSPLFLPPAFALNYGLSFAALTAALVHIGLFHGKEIWYRFRAARNQEPDVHLRLMKKYEEAPDWWYLTLLLGPSHWVLAQFSAIIHNYHGGDLKLAHYMKIPPKVTFWCQVMATIWAAFVQIAVMNWTLGNIPNVCANNQKDHFTCPNGRAFFSSSIVWGVIGPQRMFGPESIYVKFNWFWLIGAGLPVLLWVLIRKLRVPYAHHFNAPIMLGAMSWLPPATPLSFSTWAIFGLIFNYWIKKRWNGWWRTYNYLTAAGLDAGLVISTAVIFFAITLPNVKIPQWWGNVDIYNTVDASYTGWLKTVPKGETFGPPTW